MSKEMPDEVKNQIMPDGKKRVITEKIPDKYLKEMEEYKKKKGELMQKFFQLSVQIVNVQQQQKDILEKMKDTDKKIGKVVDYTFKKLKLHKRKGRRWQFRGDSFVGVYNPPSPKKQGHKGAYNPPPINPPPRQKPTPMPPPKISGRGEKPDTQKPQI